MFLGGVDLRNIPSPVSALKSTRKVYTINLSTVFDTMPSAPTPLPDTASAAADLALIASMKERGRRAAADDGWYLLIWGAIASSILFVQYFAEVGDWAPSRVLWWWQPVFLLGSLVTITIGRRNRRRRIRGNAIAATYRASFGAAMLCFVVYQLASSTLGHPHPVTGTVLLCGLLGTAFVVTGVVSEIRWLAAVGTAWWILLAYFAARSALVPTDYLVLAAAIAVLVAAPGLRLVYSARTGTRVGSHSVTHA